MACLLFLASIVAARAAGPAGNNPLEAPPTLRADGDGGDSAGPGATTRLQADTQPGAPRNDTAGRRDALGLAPREGDPDWRVRLNVARAPGDRPSSASLAQRGVVLQLSRSF